MAYVAPSGSSVEFEMSVPFSGGDGNYVNFEMDNGFATLVDSAIMSDSYEYPSEFNSYAVEIINASSVLLVDPAVAIWAIDSASFSDSSSYNFTASASESDTVSASDASSGAILAIISVSDSLSASELASPSAIFSASVSDSIVAGVMMIIDGEIYQGFAVNAKTFAASRYENFNFNSFARFDGKYFALANDGLHVLSGKSDNGSEIKARVTTGNVKVSGNMLSRIEDAYLICKNDGTVTVRVFANGEKYDYKLTKTSDFMDESRVKLGKGRKAALWQFELESDGGSSFDIESVKIYPLALSRRV